MKTILVATDFSPASLNAADYAAGMALSVNASILLLHVYQIPVSYSEVPLALNEKNVLENAENEINNLKAKLVSKTNGKITIESDVIMGILSRELMEVCEDCDPYLVVMGSQGTTPAERLIFGSHTIQAMQYLRWPLITVPVGASFSGIRKICLACDFDKAVDKISIARIKMLVTDLDAELHILNSGKEETFNPEIVFESHLLEEMLKPIKPHYHFISNENTDLGIMDFAGNNQVDLVVVLPKRHSLVDKLIHKSHSKNLALHCPIPVMAIHL